MGSRGRGKNERFHRTLSDEVFALRAFQSLENAQRALDAWREIYNFERPHEAIGLAVPADRYRPSPRPFPAKLPEVDYGEHEIVRTVPSSKDYIRFKGGACGKYRKPSGANASQSGRRAATDATAPSSPPTRSPPST